MTPVEFIRSGPNLKPVAYCDHPGCTAYAPFGFNSHLGKAIDQKDAKKAGGLCSVWFQQPSWEGHLHEDGRWYEIRPRRQISSGRRPMNWRPTGEKLDPAARAELVTQANKRDW